MLRENNAKIIKVGKIEDFKNKEKVTYQKLVVTLALQNGDIKQLVCYRNEVSKFDELKNFESKKYKAGDFIDFEFMKSYFFNKPDILRDIYNHKPNEEK